MKKLILKISGVILLFSLVVSPIFLEGLKNNRNNIYKDEQLQGYLAAYIHSLNYYGMFYEDLEGNVSEEYLKNQLEDLKQSKEEERKDAIESMNIYIEEIRLNEELSEKEKQENINNSLEKIKYINESFDYSEEELIGEIKESINYDIQGMIENSNVEFYVTNKTTGNVLNNTYDKSREEFKNNALNDDYDYIFLGESGIVCSDNIMPFQNEIIKNYSTGESEVEIMIRIPKVMVKNDQLMETYQRIENVDGFQKNFVIIGVACFILGVISLVILIQNRKRIKFGYAYKLFKELPPEIILLSITILIVTDIDIYTYPSILAGTIAIKMVALLFLIYSIVDLIKSSNSGEKYIDFNKSIILKFYRELENLKNNPKKAAKGIIYLALILIPVLFIIITLENYYDNYYGDWYYQVWIITLGLALLTILVVLFITIKWVKGLVKLEILSHKVAQGEKIDNFRKKNIKELREIEENLINMEEGLESAIKKKSESGKIKGELITNVSHDLKTPLTSIINYADILGKNNISEEDRIRYINVLKEKSHRLQSLLLDLKEASKAETGEVDINIKAVDMVSLINGVLWDMREKLSINELTLVKAIPEEEIIIPIDERKSYRILQNIVSNIGKYSLKGSRVYVQIVEKEEVKEVIVKDISNSPIEFTSKEIVERFKRGDSSRTTEGSGLGLAIAKSLMEIQGGALDIEIDGDLFKVILKFKGEI